MAVAFDYVVIVVLVGALGALLFVASTLIFLIEETAKFLIHALWTTIHPAHVWVAAHVKHGPRLRFPRHSA